MQRTLRALLTAVMVVAATGSVAGPVPSKAYLADWYTRIVEVYNTTGPASAHALWGPYLVSLCRRYGPDTPVSMLPIYQPSKMGTVLPGGVYYVAEFRGKTYYGTPERWGWRQCINTAAVPIRAVVQPELNQFGIRPGFSYPIGGGKASILVEDRCFWRLYVTKRRSPLPDGTYRVFVSRWVDPYR